MYHLILIMARVPNYAKIAITFASLVPNSFGIEPKSRHSSDDVRMAHNSYRNFFEASPKS
jgi:hypothetical protein